MKTVSTFEAKNKLSELVAAAGQGKPHLITKNGVEAAVLISYDEYRRLVARKQPLVDFLRKGPLVGSGIDLTRSKEAFDRPPIDFEGEDFK